MDDKCGCPLMRVPLPLLPPSRFRINERKQNKRKRTCVRFLFAYIYAAHACVHVLLSSGCVWVWHTWEYARARANVHKLACVQIFMHAARMLNIKSISFVSGYGVHVDLYTGLNCLSFVSLWNSIALFISFLPSRFSFLFFPFRCERFDLCVCVRVVEDLIRMTFVDEREKRKVKVAVMIFSNRSNEEMICSRTDASEIKLAQNLLQRERISIRKKDIHYYWNIINYQLCWI